MSNDSDLIYSLRKDSPLVIGKNSEGNFIASDTIAISKQNKDLIAIYFAIKSFHKLVLFFLFIDHFMQCRKCIA